MKKIQVGMLMIIGKMLELILWYTISFILIFNFYLINERYFRNLKQMNPILDGTVKVLIYKMILSIKVRVDFFLHEFKKQLIKIFLKK